MKKLIALLLLFSLQAQALKINGPLEGAQLENLSGDPTGKAGRVYYNTDTKKAKLHNGTAWADLGTGSGSGGGSGPKNFVANPSGEANAGNWTCTGANCTTDFVRDTTAGKGIAGTNYSLKFTAESSGYYVTSDAWTLDNDVTGSCEASLVYTTAAGVYTFNLMSGSTVVQSVPLPAQSAYYPAVIPYPCGNYSIRITASGAGTAINFGNVYFGKATGLGLANSVTDTQSYTPTFSASLNNPAIQAANWAKRGDKIYVQFRFITGASTTAAPATMTLPAGLSFASTGSTVIGAAWTQGYAGHDLWVTNGGGGNTVGFVANNGAGAGLNGSDLGNGQIVDGWFEAKISGWTAQGAISTNKQTLPTVQRFLSGSGTYTTPQGASWIRVRMVGGGGGGGGSGTGGAGVGGTSGTSTFGLLSAGGGSGGAAGSNSGGGSRGQGGVAALNGAGIGLAINGGWGSSTAGPNGIGGYGAASAFGGGGAGGQVPYDGEAAVVNAGGGGGGAGGNASFYGGGGGGAGGYIDAVISGPLAATYSYAVGAGGTLGGPGTSGKSGGAGGSGIIIVDEYYGSMNAPLLVGSVTSNTSGLERVERASFPKCTASPCTSLTQSGSWLTSVTRSSVGSYVLNIASGMFSATPACICSSADTSTGNTICTPGVWGTNNSTTITFSTNNNTAGPPIDSSVSIICMGPR